jgi:hypothetical protein
MTSFATAIKNAPARTENNMKALRSSANAVVDLFYSIGASRGKDIIPKFVAAFVEDPDLAVRVALWARDIREGAGERELFRNIFRHLERNEPAIAAKVLSKIPELGRWDDVLVATTPTIKEKAFRMIGDAIRNAQKAKMVLARLSTMSDAECTNMTTAITNGEFATRVSR